MMNVKEEEGQHRLPGEMPEIDLTQDSEELSDLEMGAHQRQGALLASIQPAVLAADSREREGAGIQVDEPGDRHSGRVLKRLRAPAGTPLRLGPVRVRGPAYGLPAAAEDLEDSDVDLPAAPQKRVAFDVVPSAARPDAKWWRLGAGQSADRHAAGGSAGTGRERHAARDGAGAVRGDGAGAVREDGAGAVRHAARDGAGAVRELEPAVRKRRRSASPPLPRTAARVGAASQPPAGAASGTPRPHEQQQQQQQQQRLHAHRVDWLPMHLQLHQEGSKRSPARAPPAAPEPPKPKFWVATTSPHARALPMPALPVSPAPASRGMSKAHRAQPPPSAGTGLHGHAAAPPSCSSPPLGAPAPAQHGRAACNILHEACGWGSSGGGGGGDHGELPVQHSWPPAQQREHYAVGEEGDGEGAKGEAAATLDDTQDVWQDCEQGASLSQDVGAAAEAKGMEGAAVPAILPAGTAAAADQGFGNAKQQQQQQQQQEQQQKLKLNKSGGLISALIGMLKPHSGRGKCSGGDGGCDGGSNGGAAGSLPACGRNHGGKHDGADRARGAGQKGQGTLPSRLSKAPELDISAARAPAAAAAGVGVGGAGGSAEVAAEAPEGTDNRLAVAEAGAPAGADMDEAPGLAVAEGGPAAEDAAKLCKLLSLCCAHLGQPPAPPVLLNPLARRMAAVLRAGASSNGDGRSGEGQDREQGSTPPAHARLVDIIRCAMLTIRSQQQAAQHGGQASGSLASSSPGGHVGYLPQLVDAVVTVESWYLCGLPEPRPIKSSAVATVIAAAMQQLQSRASAQAPDMETLGRVSSQVLQLVGTAAALQHLPAGPAASGGGPPSRPVCLLQQVLLEAHMHPGSADDPARAITLALAKATSFEAWQLLQGMEAWAAACAHAE